jgi:ketosteroid isomerase-like protein
MTASNAEIVRSYLNAFASGDPAAVVAHVTDDFENIQVGLLGKGCSGANVYAERLVGFLGAFADLKYDIEELIVDGDKIAAAYKMTFTDNGQSMVIEGVMVITMRDGKIAVRKDYWDGLSHIKQTVPSL